MKEKLLSGFFISLLMFFVLPQAVSAQNKKINPRDTMTVTDRYGLKLGVDLFTPIRSMLDEDFKGLEVVADYRLTKKHWLAAEVGYDEKTTDDDNQNFTTEGAYLKAGFDYNMHKNWIGMENSINLGLRGAYSTFSQTLNTFDIQSNNPFLGENTIVDGTKYSSLTASWIEVVFGIKMQVVHNVYVNANVQFKRLFNDTQPEGFKNLYIPGFNKVNDFNDFGFGFSYSISYFIPIYKKDREKPTVKK